MMEIVSVLALWLHVCAQLRPPVVERVPRAIVRTRGIARAHHWFAGRLVRAGHRPFGARHRVLEWDPGLTLLSHDVRPHHVRPEHIRGLDAVLTRALHDDR